MSDLTEQEKIRYEAMEELRALGVEPYPADLFPVTHHSQDILDGFEKDPDNYGDVCLAGRIMTRRIMGNASFAVMQDETGRIQLYFNRDEICPGDDKTMYNQKQLQQQ